MEEARVREAAARLAEALGRTGRVTVLTGAGVSAESGVPTFRDAGGVWERYAIEDVATPGGYRRNPALVLEFYNHRRRDLKTVDPNPAHRALARLERLLPGRFTLITQNVDDLHERAGSTSVLHMHGELMKARCARCGRVVEWHRDIGLDDGCDECGASLRPHVVWFGEIPFHLEDEIPAALAAEVFLSVGTSGIVYPAAGFVQTARAGGSLTVEVNLEPSENAFLFEIQLTGRAGAILPALVEDLARRLAGGNA